MVPTETTLSSDHGFFLQILLELQHQLSPLSREETSLNLNLIVGFSVFRHFIGINYNK